jgi:hypothetical protein
LRLVVGKAQHLEHRVGAEVEVARQAWVPVGRSRRGAPHDRAADAERHRDELDEVHPVVVERDPVRVGDAGHARVVLGPALLDPTPAGPVQGGIGRELGGGEAGPDLVGQRPSDVALRSPQHEVPHHQEVIGAPGQHASRH